MVNSKGTKNTQVRFNICHQHLKRKYLLPFSMYGNDSHLISDGCQAVNDYDKIFWFPSWEDLKELWWDSSPSYYCDEQAYREIFINFLCLALFNQPPNVLVM